jgi:hypothetical protein
LIDRPNRIFARRRQVSPKDAETTL